MGLLRQVLFHKVERAMQSADISQVRMFNLWELGVNIENPFQMCAHAINRNADLLHHRTAEDNDVRRPMDDCIIKTIRKKTCHFFPKYLIGDLKWLLAVSCGDCRSGDLRFKIKTRTADRHLTE